MMFGTKQPKLEIIIGAESAIKGDIISKGTVRIDGGVEGNITADCLIISEKGGITGDAVVRQIVVGGNMVGTIRASESAEIQRTGDVRGDIVATRLSIADGGRFEGHSSMMAAKEITYESGD